MNRKLFEHQIFDYLIIIKCINVCFLINISNNLKFIIMEILFSSFSDKFLGQLEQDRRTKRNEIKRHPVDRYVAERLDTKEKDRNWWSRYSNGMPIRQRGGTWRGCRQKTFFSPRSRLNMRFPFLSIPSYLPNRSHLPLSLSL